MRCDVPTRARVGSCTDRQPRHRDRPTTRVRMSDPLDRFVSAQNGVYDRAVAELRDGRKRSHWMWFVFPQIAGLGMSATSQHYAIASLDEAHAYLAHPILGPRLRECAAVVAASETPSAELLLG